MLKFLLTGCCCLFVLLSFSQEEELTNAIDTLVITDKYDSNKIAEELDAVVHDNAKVFLSWKVELGQVDFFAIERSCNGKDFETMAVLKQTSRQLKMDWIDEQPARGKNLYRIRCSYSDGQSRYSKSIMAYIGGNVSFRFYPNPADNILIIRSEQAIDVTIIDGNGRTRITQNLLSGLQLLNISSLEKGVYIIRIYNRQSNTLLQEKLVKN
jgi:hypothetical protein